MLYDCPPSTHSSLIEVLSQDRSRSNCELYIPSFVRPSKTVVTKTPGHRIMGWETLAIDCLTASNLRTSDGLSWRNLID